MTKRTTAATYLAWEDLTGLLLKLKRDQEYKFRLLVGIGCMTGLRFGDLVKLNWEQLLDKDKLIVVEGKTMKRRVLVINEDLKLLIRDSYNLMKPANLSSPLFLNKYGTKTIRIQWVNQKLKKIFKSYGLLTKGVSSHLLRKTFGRAIWENNNHSEQALIMLSEIFGHSSVAITRRYLGLRQEELNNLYSELRL